MTILSRQVRTFAGASLSTAYQNVGATVTIPGRLVTIVNSTTTDVQVTDGSSSDAWYVPAGSTISASQTGQSPQADSSVVAVAQTQYQAKLPSGSAGTGTLVITTLGN